MIENHSSSNWIITYSTSEKKKMKKPTLENLKKRKLSDRDRTWLQKLALRQDPSKLPETVLKKLIAKGLIEIKLTSEGRKAGIIEAIKNV